MNYSDLFRSTLPEIVLECAALLALVIDLAALRSAAQKTRAMAAALIGAAGCAAALCAVGLTQALNFDGSPLLAAGGSAGVAQCGVLILTALTLLLFIDTGFTRNPSEYVAVILMSAGGGLFICAAQDLLVIFIGLELLSLGLYILTAFAKQSGKSAEAAIKYYLFGGISAAFLLFGFSYLYGLSGSTSLPRVIDGVNQAAAHGGGPLLAVALVMIAAGLGFKIAAVPFHWWAPDTYEGAPAPAAAFIASVSKVASFALLISIGFASLNYLRMVPGPSAPGTGSATARIAAGASYGVTRIAAAPAHSQFSAYCGWSILLTILAIASMIFGNLAALAQTSVRRLLAYSAVAHAGYILLGLAFYAWGDRNSQIVLYYVLTYGLTTVGAFGVVGVVERATGSDRMDAFLGLHKRNPLLAAVTLVLFLSLAGIPPLVGFWAKFNLFAGVLGFFGGNLRGTASGAGLPLALVILAVVFSAVSLYYYLQVLKRVYVMPAAGESPVRAHPVTLVVLATIGAAVVVLGCLPALLQNWIAGFYPHL